MGKKIEIIDFLKGFSIFTIVWMHFLMNVHLPAVFDKIIPFGGTGIHVFIFVSGFGLYLGNNRKPLPYGLFLKKRFLKIYTPVTITVLLVFLICIFIPIYPLSFYALLGHLFLYKMFDESIIGSYGYQFWFVSTIIQLYIVFPLLIKLENKIGIRKLVILSYFVSLSWSIAVLLLHKADLRVWNSFFLQFLWEFVLGMFAANQFIYNGFRFENIRFPALIGATFFGLLLFYLLVTYFRVIGKMTDDLPALIGYLGLAIIVYRLNIKYLKVFFLKIGELSFQFFLLHYCILQIGLYYCRKFQYNFNILYCIVLFGIAYVLSIWTNKLVNKLYLVLDL